MKPRRQRGGTGRRGEPAVGGELAEGGEPTGEEEGRPKARKVKNPPQRKRRKSSLRRNPRNGSLTHNGPPPCCYGAIYGVFYLLKASYPIMHAGYLGSLVLLGFATWKTRKIWTTFEVTVLYTLLLGGTLVALLQRDLLPRLGTLLLRLGVSPKPPPLAASSPAPKPAAPVKPALPPQALPPQASQTNRLHRQSHPRSRSRRSPSQTRSHSLETSLPLPLEEGSGMRAARQKLQKHESSLGQSPHHTLHQRGGCNFPKF